MKANNFSQLATKMTPTANIILMFFQTAAARRQSAWTARQLAAAVDKCERSVKSAICQLQSAGEIRVNDAGAVVVPTAEPSFPGDTVQPEECCLVVPVEPIDEQLTLFDADPDGAPSEFDLNASRGAAEGRREKLATPVQAATCRVCRPRQAEAIPWGVGDADNSPTDEQKTTAYCLLPTASPSCTSVEQSLNKVCTNPEKSDRMAALQAAMNRLAETLDNKRACTPDAPARPMKQEKNINTSMNYESPMGISYEGATNSEFGIRNSELTQAAPRRDEALYNYYLSDLKRRFPDWSKPIFNPATNQTGNCKWAIETLAAIMAWGAPESVYADVVDFCFGKNRNTSAKNPAAAFLFKVKELKEQYRWRQ